MSDLLRSPDLTIEKGLDFSIPSVYLGQGKNFPQNFQLYRGEMKKRDGRTVLGGVMLGGQKVLHLGVLELSSGTQRLIRHSKQNVERWNAGAGQWEDITPFPGGDLTGTELDFFQSCVVTESDLYLFTQRKDAIKKYGDSGKFASLGGSPPKAGAIEYLSPYVLIGDILDGASELRSKVAWCDTGQPEVWSGGNSGSVLLADEPSFIKRIKKLLEYAFVYKEKSVYRGRQVGGSSIFDFGGPFYEGKGIASRRAIAGNGSSDFYMGLFDFHENNGVRIFDIGAPVREYIFNRLNRARIETCFALHVELYKEVWFFVTPVGFDWPSEVWKYNYERGFWYYDTVQNCITAANYKQTTSLTWNTYKKKWSEAVGTWNTVGGLSDAPFQVFGYKDGFIDRVDPSVSLDREAAFTAKIESKDYTGLVHRGIEYDSRWQQFDVWARGRGKIRLSYSTDYGSTWVSVGDLELPDTTEKLSFWFDVVAAHIRFRVEILDIGQIRSWTPYYLDEPETYR